jgi:hypothetical protein
MYLLELEVQHMVVGVSGGRVKFPFGLGDTCSHVTINKKASDEACLKYF